jgi:hypothetical protein
MGVDQRKWEAAAFDKMKSNIFEKILNHQRVQDILSSLDLDQSGLSQRKVLEALGWSRSYFYQKEKLNLFIHRAALTKWQGNPPPGIFTLQHPSNFLISNLWLPRARCCKVQSIQDSCLCHIPMGCSGAGHPTKCKIRKQI